MNCWSKRARSFRISGKYIPRAGHRPVQQLHSFPSRQYQNSSLRQYRRRGAKRGGERRLHSRHSIAQQRGTIRPRFNKSEQTKQRKQLYPHHLHNKRACHISRSKQNKPHAHLPAPPRSSLELMSKFNARGINLTKLESSSITAGISISSSSSI
jgi:hypothetical protein